MEPESSPFHRTNSCIVRGAFRSSGRYHLRTCCNCPCPQRCFLNDPRKHIRLTACCSPNAPQNLPWLNCSAESNMYCIVVTLDTSHAQRLVKLTCVHKHFLHICHLTRPMTAKVGLIAAQKKRPLHPCHFGCVPCPQRLVEPIRLMEHVANAHRF